MRQNIKIPRILKINRIEESSVSVTFNNGEHRIIDFRKVLIRIGVNKNSPAYILYNAEELSKACIMGNTLSWNNVEQYITKRNGEKVKVPFELGADVLFKYSEPEKSEFFIKLGQLVKETRLSMGLTQQDLAIKSGTSRTYISRIENNRSDFEITTLKKIIEIGLDRKLDISIK